MNHWRLCRIADASPERASRSQIPNKDVPWKPCRSWRWNWKTDCVSPSKRSSTLRSENLLLSLLDEHCHCSCNFLYEKHILFNVVQPIWFRVCCFCPLTRKWPHVLSCLFESPQRNTQGRSYRLRTCRLGILSSDLHLQLWWLSGRTSLQPGLESTLILAKASGVECICRNPSRNNNFQVRIVTLRTWPLGVSPSVCLVAMAFFTVMLG